MSAPQRTERLVSRMSYRQRAELLHVLQINAAQRDRSGPAPGRVGPGETAIDAAPCTLPARIANQPPLATLLPLFDSAAWKQVWRPGVEFHLYVIGCPALGRVVEGIGAAAKIGTAQVGGLDRRLRELRRQEYGSVARTAAGWVHAKGWDAWSAFRRVQLEVTPPACPVRGADQTLILTVPQGWSPGEAEALVNEVLAPFRLHRFAVGDAGRAICGERNVDPDTLIRYSGTETRFQAATELTLVRAQADAPRIAGLVAAALARRMRATASDPAAPAWRILDRARANVAPAATAPERRRKCLDSSSASTAKEEWRRPQSGCQQMADRPHGETHDDDRNDRPLPPRGDATLRGRPGRDAHPPVVASRGPRPGDGSGAFTPGCDRPRPTPTATARWARRRLPTARPPSSATRCSPCSMFHTSTSRLRRRRARR